MTNDEWRMTNARETTEDEDEDDDEDDWGPTSIRNSQSAIRNRNGLSVVTERASGVGGVHSLAPLGEAGLEAAERLGLL